VPSPPTRNRYRVRTRYRFALAALAAAATHAHALAPAAAIAALDCANVSAREVREVLAQAPAPRIVAISGTFNDTSMDPFARFLVAMGYPAGRVRNPADGAWSYPNTLPSAALAGMVAWYYERDGVAPLLIGHSGGGMLALRTLHELAGAFNDHVAVVDPVTGEKLPRDTIVDPRTGRERPALGLKVPYASALATGKLPRLWLGQWAMLPKMRSVPDTVDEFTGLTLEWDLIAGTFPGSEPYAATGTARVRNVTLPATYQHIDLPRTEHLATDPATRAWIEAWRPDADPPPLDAGVDATNLLHAADIWHSVAKHWCLAAKDAAR
jgi:hypothetical protein